MTLALKTFRLHPTDAHRLRALIRRYLMETNQTNEQLAVKLGRHPKWLSNIKHSKAIPPPELLDLLGLEMRLVAKASVTDTEGGSCD